MTSQETARSVSLTILGHLPSMKNSRRILRQKGSGRPFSAKSEESVRYVGDFCLQVPPEAANGALTGPLRTHVSVWYRSERSDLDCALVYDCLQASGVIRNDRQIIEKHEYRHVDKKNPRVEITIEEL